MSHLRLLPSPKRPNGESDLERRIREAMEAYERMSPDERPAPAAPGTNRFAGLDDDAEDDDDDDE